MPPNGLLCFGSGKHDPTRLESYRFMPPKTAFSLAASWTHKPDSEKQQEHDFSNLLQEFGYALRRQDGKMIEYFECELRRMYRDRRP